MAAPPVGAVTPQSHHPATGPGELLLVSIPCREHLCWAESSRWKGARGKSRPFCAHLRHCHIPRLLRKPRPSTWSVGGPGPVRGRPPVPPSLPWRLSPAGHGWKEPRVCSHLPLPAPGLGSPGPHTGLKGEPGGEGWLGDRLGTGRGLLSAGKRGRRGSGQHRGKDRREGEWCPSDPQYW